MGRIRPFRPGVVCGACDEWLTLLTHAHMKIKHNTTQFEYLVLYPEHCDSTLWGNEHGRAARTEFKKLELKVKKERKARGYE